MIEFRNITNIRSDPNDPEATICDLEIRVEGEEWSLVEYCARENGGGISDKVLEVIRNGD